MPQEKILLIPAQKTPFLELLPIRLHLTKETSPLQKELGEDFKTFLSLYELALKNPKKAKQEVETLYNKYPNIPDITNLLTFIYLGLRKLKKANRLIEELYKKHPSYLTGRLNYADLMLRRKESHKVPLLFENTFDLAKLYPNKKSFYVGEFLSFNVIMGLYHLEIGEKEKALVYHYLAYKIDSKHQGVFLLTQKLYPKISWKKRLQQLFKNALRGVNQKRPSPP